MKKYGIYILFSPLANLKKEGLGRHLGYFLKASQKRNDVKFFVACPSWLRPRLIDLFKDFQIECTAINIISPKGLPFFSV